LVKETHQDTNMGIIKAISHVLRKLAQSQWIYADLLTNLQSDSPFKNHQMKIEYNVKENLRWHNHLQVSYFNAFCNNHLRKPTKNWTNLLLNYFH